MEIFNMIRGHFALLKDKPLATPSKECKFHIEEVNTDGGDWQMVLRLEETDTIAKIYISDILRIYTFIVSCNRPLSQKRINKFVESNCVTKGITSYALPLIGAFSDIEVSKDPKFTIRFIPLREQLID